MCTASKWEAISLAVASEDGYTCCKKDCKEMACCCDIPGNCAEEILEPVI
jgi:hypothetical protein